MDDPLNFAAGAYAHYAANPDPALRQPSQDGFSVIQRAGLTLLMRMSEEERLRLFCQQSVRVSMIEAAMEELRELDRTVASMREIASQRYAAAPANPPPAAPQNAERPTPRNGRKVKR